MTIPNISTNSLVDQTQLNQIIDTVNSISSKFANTISPIYNTTTNQVVNSYMGTFAIATNRKADSLAIAETGNKIYSTEISISFGKTFLAPPLVFPSVELDSGAITNYIPAVIATNISNSGCTITLNVFKLAAATKGNLGFKVNVMAVGLTQL